jgi:hypothetical protein
MGPICVSREEHARESLRGGRYRRAGGGSIYSRVGAGVAALGGCADGDGGGRLGSPAVVPGGCAGSGADVGCGADSAGAGAFGATSSAACSAQLGDGMGMQIGIAV